MFLLLLIVIDIQFFPMVSLGLSNALFLAILCSRFCSCLHEVSLKLSNALFLDKHARFCLCLHKVLCRHSNALFLAIIFVLISMHILSCGFYCSLRSLCYSLAFSGCSSRHFVFKHKTMTKFRLTNFSRDCH